MSQEYAKLQDDLRELSAVIYKARGETTQKAVLTFLEKRLQKVGTDLVDVSPDQIWEMRGAAKELKYLLHTFTSATPDMEPERKSGPGTRRPAGS